MRRLYYVADNLSDTDAVSAALHAEGIRDWNFHVVSRDEAGLYQHRIHSANTYQQLDVLHTGARFALLGLLCGFALGMLCLVSAARGWLGFEFGGAQVLLITLVGLGFGAWQGGMIGLSRENYKLARFHGDIDAGGYLIMVDAGKQEGVRVRELMNMRFPAVRFEGTDSIWINPFQRPEKIYTQTTH